MNKKGFTLVELLGVIAILAIIIGIAFAIYTRVQKDVLTSQLENVLSYIETQAISYANDTNITVVSVEDLILNGYVEPDDETDIYNPVDNSSLNCYIVRSTYEDGEFTAELKLTSENYMADANGTCTNYEKGSAITIYACKSDGTCEEIGNNWYNENVTLEIRYPDGSTFQEENATYEWKTNQGTNYDTATITTNVAANNAITLPYTVNVTYLKDAENVIATASKIVKIDMQPPEILETIIKDEATWTNTEKEITIRVTDYSGSGVYGIYVGDKDCSSLTIEDFEKLNDDKYTTTKNNGTYNVCLRDNAGNQSADTYTFEISHVDTVAPTCTITTSAQMGANNWYIENANLVLNTSDDASGISQKGMSTSSKVNYNNVTASLQRNTKGTTYYGYVKDEAGNVGSCNLNVKVDSTPPEISFSISGIDTAIMTCSDDTSGINGKTNYNQRLTGTRDYTVNQTCTNNAGISATDSHTYDYSSCARGENTCRPGCDEYYDDCKYGDDTCEYGCGKKYDSCASGSDTCSGGYDQNCTQEKVCVSATQHYCCFAHVGSQNCVDSTSPCVIGGPSYSLCNKYEINTSCTTGSYNPCQSGSDTCQGGYVTDYSSCSDCYTGENTCRGGFVTIESTCSDCYYGHNTCEGGFLY